MASLLELILLLAPCVYPVIASMDNLPITQTPSKLQTGVGNSVEMFCSWNIFSEVVRFRVTWKKNSDLQDNIKQTVYNRSNSTKEQLKLDNLKINDSGLYLCEVTIEIPIFRTGRGPGTNLTVEDFSEQKEKWKENWPWWALTIFPVLILSTSLSCCYCKKQKISKRIGQNRTDQEEKQEDVYLKMGNIKREDIRTPDNTEEWAASVLYEPMDYFAVKPIDRDYSLLYSDKEPSDVDLTISSAESTTSLEQNLPKRRSAGNRLGSQTEME